MKTLLIDRSTPKIITALVDENGETELVDLGIWGTGSVEPKISFPRPLDRIVVGIGPGSFAGIRSALGFAQGYALGSDCEVLGLTSAAAYAKEDERIAVVGDSRRGKFWIALFDGFNLSNEVFQSDLEDLGEKVPREFRIVSPDSARIGDILEAKFGPRYSAAGEFSAASFALAFTKNASLLAPQPLPIYLNPAVRD